MQLQGSKTGSEAKYGPPTHVRRKPYNLMLELLESQANRKLVSEYQADGTKVLAQLEASRGVNPAMIELQPEIQWFMRPFLLDFLIELHSSFKLQPQTLFLCLNIIDRYCAKRIVFKRHYQLVGCTALWIAGKYEDKKSRVPTLRELSIMCRNAYDEEMFIQMEMHILATLEWSLSHANLEECLQLAISSCDITTHGTPCKYNNIDDKSNTMNNTSKVSAVTAVGRFLCELSLYDKFFLSLPPSLIAVTANLMACSMLQIPNASASLRAIFKKYTSESEIPGFDFNEYDENSENRQPEVEGPFLSGFDSSSLNTIRKICLMLIVQLGKITDVLSKKYDDLGVIQVVKNFNNRYSFAVSAIYENQNIVQEASMIELTNSKLCNLADIVLQLPNLNLETRNENHVPLTPPSATSQYSVFSNKSLVSVCTPIHSTYLPSSERMDDFSPMQDPGNNGWSSPASSAKIHI